MARPLRAAPPSFRATRAPAVRAVLGGMGVSSGLGASSGLGILASLAGFAGLAVLAVGCARPAPPPARFEPVPGRPYEVRLPKGHDAKKPAGALFLLHAYSTTPRVQESYFRFGDALDRRGWMLVLPQGTKDRDGQPFWNATEACCDRFGAGVDDLAYLDRVFEDLARRYAIDPRRVFALGMSNGGFFAHRLACDRSARFTAVASLAGTGFLDPARCAPARPVGVLQVHGDADDVVLYRGGELLLDAPLAAYPAARVPLERWAAANGCGGPAVRKSALDFDQSVPGAEVTAEAWQQCAAPVELWTVPGGGHGLPPARGATEAILGFFDRAGAAPARR